MIRDVFALLGILLIALGAGLIALELGLLAVGAILFYLGVFHGGKRHGGDDT